MNEFKQMRLQKGYTQVELSELLGITPVQISRIENGKYKVKKWHKLALQSIPQNNRCGQ